MAKKPITLTPKQTLWLIEKLRAIAATNGMARGLGAEFQINLEAYNTCPELSGLIALTNDVLEVFGIFDAFLAAYYPTHYQARSV